MSEKVTGYQACQEMVHVLLAEIRALKAAQQRRSRDDSFTGPARALADACSKLQGEIRKTGDDADKAVGNLPAERQVQLVMKMVEEWSPEFRSVLRLHLEELGEALLA